MQGFDWESLDYFGLLDLCSLMGGSRLRDVVAKLGFDCIKNGMKMMSTAKIQI